MCMWQIKSLNVESDGKRTRETRETREQEKPKPFYRSNWHNRWVTSVTINVNLLACLWCFRKQGYHVDPPVSLSPACVWSFTMSRNKEAISTLLTSRWRANLGLMIKQTPQPLPHCPIYSRSSQESQESGNVPGCCLTTQRRYILPKVYSLSENCTWQGRKYILTVLVVPKQHLSCTKYQVLKGPRPPSLLVCYTVV